MQKIFSGNNTYRYKLDLISFFPSVRSHGEELRSSGLLVECGKKWKIVRKILPNSAGNSAEKSEIVRENAK